jgi:hypothetical protein
MTLHSVRYVITVHSSKKNIISRKYVYFSESLRAWGPRENYSYFQLNRMYFHYTVHSSECTHYVSLVLLQNVPRQNVPRQNDPIQKVPAPEHPSYKTSQHQNVPSHKTSPAPKGPNPKTSQPQKVPASKRPKPQNVPAPKRPNSKTSLATKRPKPQNVPSPKNIVLRDFLYNSRQLLLKAVMFYTEYNKKPR